MTERVTLGDVCTIINGKNQRAVENPKGIYPIYGSGGIMGRADSYLCPANTVIIGRKGNINDPIYVREPFWNVDTAFGIVADSNRLDSEYLYHFCRFFDFTRLNSTVTIPSLTKKAVQKIDMTLPSLDEQRRIAVVLSHIDSMHDLCRCMLDKYDELIQARFVEMFGDPVINGHQWASQQLHELGELRNGLNFTRNQQGRTYKVLGVSDFQDEAMIGDTSTLQTVTLANELPPEALLQRDDIVFVRSNGNRQLIGRNVLIEFDDSDVAFSGFCIRFRLQQDDLNPLFLNYLLKNRGIKQTLLHQGRGANIANLNQGMLAALNIIIPPLSLQQDFAAFVEQVNQMKDETTRTLEQLRTLYDSLAQDYFAI